LSFRQKVFGNGIMGGERGNERELRRRGGIHSGFQKVTCVEISLWGTPLPATTAAASRLGAAYDPKRRLVPGHELAKSFVIR
jgi:hypothetical protein